MASALPSETAGPETRPRSGSATDSEVLVLDGHTIKDLQIFEQEAEGASLFDLCDLTRSKGGAKALRRRMEHPWSSAARIRATQASLSFILAQRPAFDKLPSLPYATGRVERYLRDILPLVTHENVAEFSFGALALRVNDSRNYDRIVLGVQITCELIRALRDFVGQAELRSPAGELLPLLDEMRALLARPRLSRIPHREIGAWRAWKLLRTDQVFRLHEKLTIARLLQLVYELDALVALADVTRERGFVMPSVEGGSLRVHAEQLVHPLVADPVANPVELDSRRRVLFLTGPNMAGKTTYLRAFATAMYLAHLGMGVPARSFRFAPAQRLFSSISLGDDLQHGVSYFRAEALRVKAIAEAVAEGYRVVAIMDEPFKGTNVKDAFDASLAILERFAARRDCLFMFSSHLIELGERLAGLGKVDCRYFEADERGGRLRFEYLLRPGVSEQRLGMRVLREEGIFELLDGKDA